MTLVLHPHHARSQRRSRHSEVCLSFDGGAFRGAGLYVDRGTTGAVVMAWDRAQREGQEWVPLDDADLQIWLAGLPAYVAPSRRCSATPK